jgi:putative addiction module CopG family antidote
LGVFAWLLLKSASAERPALLACVVLASLGAVVLSLAWGLYDYRLGNIPPFVPPGHVLLFALGGWLAPRLPARMPAATAGFAVVMALALAFSQRDLLSVPLVLLFLASLRYGPTPRLYSAMFVLALAMELWGTWLGNWAWRPVAPGLGWPTLNPPFAAGAFQRRQGQVLQSSVVVTSPSIPALSIHRLAILDILAVCQYENLAKELPMPTRNVVLTDHQARFVERLVTSGRYQNASEVLREGLRLVERRESVDEMRLAALREAARIGIADIDGGAFRSFDSADALGRHLATLAAETIGP